MNKGTIVFTALYALLSIVHLIFCFFELEKARKISKPFLLPLLGIAMCFYIPRHPMIPTACFLAFVGDIILIWNKKKQMFALGAMFFFASHVLNFFSLKKLFSFKIPVYVYIIIPIMMVLAGVILFFIKKKDWISFLVGVFGLAHSINLILSIILIIDGTVVPGILVSLGYVLCISSDLILERVTFKKDIRRRDFPIMLTYLLGQALTYFGLAMASLLL